MKIAGYNPNSLVDFPGNIAAIVFTAGCDMRCWYCHNKHILGECQLLDEDEVLAKIEKNKLFLDAVVITGGEPMLQDDLLQFADKIKKMGLIVKLDTNGKNPDKLEQLIKSGKIDYIAMDLKAPLEDYDLVTRTDEKAENFRRSIKLIMESGLGYEFRTTVFPQLSIVDIMKIAEEIKGAKLYYLQNYNNVDGFNFKPHPPEFLTEAADAVREAVAGVKVRNL